MTFFSYREYFLDSNLDQNVSWLRYKIMFLKIALPFFLIFNYLHVLNIMYLYLIYSLIIIVQFHTFFSPCLCRLCCYSCYSLNLLKRQRYFVAWGVPHALMPTRCHSLLPPPPQLRLSWDTFAKWDTSVLLPGFWYMPSISVSEKKQ